MTATMPALLVVCCEKTGIEEVERRVASVIHVS